MMHRTLGALAATTLAMAGLVLAAPTAQAADPTPGTWSSTGSTSTARFFHTATLLPNGEVLVAGGENSSVVLASAELYNPATGSWSSTSSLGTAREVHTATLLPNGEVLVAGGQNSTGVLASAELYNPATGGWSTTGSMSTARSRHTATLLPNGEVLVAGGFTGSGPLASAELYNPATGSWSSTGSMGTARFFPTATLLPNGEVLAAGGEGTAVSFLASAELYNLATGSWSSTGSMSTAREHHKVTLLPDGHVLVAGGFNSSGFLASAELYNPATGSWSSTGSLSTAREEHTATVLADGQVLVAGGLGSTASLASAELYDPATGTWVSAGSMTTAREIHTATLLPDGKVLVAGGLSSTGPLASAELYSPGTAAEQPISNTQAVAFSGTEGNNSCGTVATFSDADSKAVAADYTAMVDWGGGTPPTAGTITDDGNGNFTVAGCHMYAEEGKATITVGITDVDNPSNNTTVISTATIFDAPFSGSCTAPVAAGTAFAGPTAMFNDASSTGTLSDFSATIDWGDGSSSAGAITGGPGNAFYTVSGAHTYATPGFYTIATTINDAGGVLTVSCGSQTFVFPPSTPGCDISGAGVIKAANGDKAKFRVDAEVVSHTQNNDDEDNNGAEIVQTYRDLGLTTPFRFRSTQTLAVTCNNDASGSIYGTGTVDSTTSVFFIIDVTAGNRDESERGPRQNEDEGNPATYRIHLSNGYDSGLQRVRSGGIDVQIEQDNEHRHGQHGPE